MEESTIPCFVALMEMERLTDEERAHHHSTIFSLFGVDICGLYSRMDVIESQTEAFRLLEQPIHFVVLELDKSINTLNDEIAKLEKDMESGINDENMRNRVLELRHMEESNQRKSSWIRKKNEQLLMLIQRNQEDLDELYIEIEEAKSYYSKITSNNIESIERKAI